MNLIRVATIALVIGVHTHASAIDTYDDGDPIPADKGVLIFKVERERTQHAAVSRRGNYQMELRRVGSSDRVSLNTPSRVKGYLLVPGRWYIYSLRDIEGGMDVTGIATPSEGFMVEAGQASWAGTVKLALGASGTRIDLAQDEAARAELTDKFEKLLATGALRRVLLGGDSQPLDPNAQP